MIFLRRTKGWLYDVDFYFGRLRQVTLGGILPPKPQSSLTGLVVGLVVPRTTSWAIFSRPFGTDRDSP
jgi:hypothetical protein